MPVFEVPFGEWLPDLPDYKNPGVVEADNVYPKTVGYGPLATPVISTSTVTNPVNGAQMFFDNLGNTVICGGTADALFTKRSGTIVETSGYTATERWNFERFGDLIIAVSAENVPQYLTDLDSDDTWSALPGNPPTAAQVGKVGDFLVLGDLTDIAGLGSPVVPNRVRWGAFNNPTANWVTDRGELSDFRDLDPRYGRVTAIVGGRFGLVFQERAIWRMTFVGASKVFEFTPVSIDRGCIASGSAVTIAADTFFLSQDGFWATNGSDVTGIGAQKVNRWFGDEVSDSNIRLTHGALNWPERSIVWTFQPEGVDGFTRQVIYQFVEQKWSSASQTVDYLVRSQIDALTLGDLAALFPGGIGSMSAYTLGSSEWQATDLSFAAFVPNLQDGAFSSGFSLGFRVEGAGTAFAEMSGPAAQAEIVTGDTEIQTGRRARVTGSRPMVEADGAQVTMKVRTRQNPGGAIAISPEAQPGADGFAPHNVDGWFHSMRTTIPAGEAWRSAVGVQVRAEGTGRR